MDFFAKFSSGLSELHVAAQNGDLSKVRQVLQKGGDPEKTTTKEKKTALHIAAEKGYDIIAAELLDRQAKCTVLDVDSNTPLLLAAKGGHVKVVQLLLGHRNKNGDKQQQLTIKNKVGYTPLLAAAEAGHSTVIEEIYRMGEAFHSFDNHLVHDCLLDGSTALHLAAKKGHVRVLILLRALGGELDGRSLEGSSPLHLAAANGQSQAVGWLLQAGANVHAKNNNGKTAIEVARDNSHGLIVRLLKDYALTQSQLSTGALYDTRNSDGRLGTTSCPLEGAAEGDGYRHSADAPSLRGADAVRTQPLYPSCPGVAQ